jgi:hypothetical protein
MGTPEKKEAPRTACDVLTPPDLLDPQETRCRSRSRTICLPAPRSPKRA